MARKSDSSIVAKTQADADDEDYKTAYADQQEEPWFKPWKVFSLVCTHIAHISNSIHLEPICYSIYSYFFCRFKTITNTKCGLCEKMNDVEQHFCAVCQRDRSLEYKWTYSFKQSKMQLKTYQPFVKPEVTWDSIAEQETWD